MFYAKLAQAEASHAEAFRALQEDHDVSIRTFIEAAKDMADEERAQAMEELKKNRSAKLDVLGDRVEKHCRAFLHVRFSRFGFFFCNFDFSGGGYGKRHEKDMYDRPIMWKATLNKIQRQT